MNDKNWFDALSEILNKPIPGTEQKEQPPAEKPVIFTDDDDDASLLDKITDILSKPLPGSGPAADTSPSEPENPGETAIREAEKPDADPVSTTAVAGADWMQREYERFNAHQERNRQALMQQQRVEQERFVNYQRTQLEQFISSQERVFKQHQEMRFKAWQMELKQAYGPAPGLPPPGMMPPPPPPWWRKG